MKGNVYHSGDMSGNNPNWYWKNGLHDTKIVSIEQLQLVHDYKIKNPIRNLFKLYVNSSHSLYDRSIKSITFINYKIMTAEIELKNCYWLQDILTFDNGKYILNITVTDCNNDYIFTISFDNAVVER